MFKEVVSERRQLPRKNVQRQLFQDVSRLACSSMHLRFFCEIFKVDSAQTLNNFDQGQR
jgi:hypothetical protein